MALVTFTLNLPVVFRNEGGWIIAAFPNIDVVSQGRTREEATHNLIEATRLFVESCFERGVLDEVLKECGFQPHHGGSIPASGAEHLTVPFELLAARNGTQTHIC